MDSKEKELKKKKEPRVLVCFMGFLYPVEKKDLAAFRSFVRDFNSEK